MRYAAVFFLLIFTACQGGIKRAAAPKDLIKRDSMVIVLHDLVILESYVESRYPQVQSFHKIMTASGKQCLKEFHISPKRFERSFDYYSAHQDVLQSIYSEVLENLNKEMNQLNAQGIRSDSSMQVRPDLNGPFPEDN